MRTEDDLRAAIDTLADSGPADALAGIQLPTERVRNGPRIPRLVLAIAALVVVLAVVAVSLVTRTQEGAPADRRVAGYWQLISQVEPPAGWQVSGRGIEGTREYTELTLDGEQGRTCTVLVYGRHQFVGGPTTGRAARVGDRPATFEPGTGQEPAILTWSYDDDAYAQVSCLVDRTVDELVALASATRFDRATDLPLPFRPGELPAGYHVDAVRSREDGGFLSSGVELNAAGSPTLAVANAAAGFDPAGPGMPGIEELELNGRPATLREDQRALQIMVGSGYLRVMSYASDTQSWLPGEREAVLTVATGLRAADSMTDAGTWFTARDALR